jgi:hypothetical protein
MQAGLFDHRIVNDNLDDAFEQLKNVVDKDVRAVMQLHVSDSMCIYIISYIWLSNALFVCARCTYLATYIHTYIHTYTHANKGKTRSLLVLMLTARS